MRKKHNFVSIEDFVKKQNQVSSIIGLPLVIFEGQYEISARLTYKYIKTEVINSQRVEFWKSYYVDGLLKKIGNTQIPIDMNYLKYVREPQEDYLLKKKVFEPMFKYDKKKGLLILEDFEDEPVKPKGEHNVSWFNLMPALGGAR